VQVNLTPEPPTLPLFYRWRRVNWEPNYFFELYSFTNVLVFTNVNKLDHEGQWRVSISNYAGEANTFLPATLTVLEPPTIIEPPTDQLVNPGGIGTFSVVAAGTAPFTYQWWQGGTNMVAGATGATFDVLDAQAGVNDGDYAVVVSNSYGAVTSTVARLIIRLAPGITLQPTNQTVTPCASNVLFSVTAEGGGTLRLSMVSERNQCIGRRDQCDSASHPFHAGNSGKLPGGHNQRRGCGHESGGHPFVYFG